MNAANNNPQQHQLAPASPETTSRDARDGPTLKDFADTTMGRKLNLGHLSEAECEKILQVIQRDFELRNAEKDRLG